MKKKLSNLKSWSFKVWNADINKIDYVITGILLLFCYFSYLFGDIVVTGNRSFLYHTNPLDFYDECFKWTGDYGANYMPSTFILFAIWNLPLRLFGRVPGTVYVNSIVNNMWYKLLPVIVYYISAQLIYKIGIYLGFSEKKAKLCKYAFLTCPLAVFSQFIFGQYDIFTILFILLGFYYFLKDDTKKFILFFGIAVTFKYQALVYFAVLLLLKEKRVLAIIRNVFLVSLPLLLEILIYYPSVYFRKSVLGFGAISYIQTGINLGGLSEISPFLAVCIGLAVAAYLIKTDNSPAQLFKWGVFLGNGVSFAFFGLVGFHPQWIMLVVPFMILGIFGNKNMKFLLLLENIYIIVYYVFVTNAYKGLVDQHVFNYSIWKNHLPSSWALNMSDVYKYDNLTYLFTCIWMLLLIYFICCHPKFSQKDLSVVEKDVAGNVRMPFYISVILWTIPAYICLASAMRGEQVVYDGSGIADMTPVSVTETQTVSQSFESTTDYIYQIDAEIGTFGRINDSSLWIRLRDEGSNEIVFEKELNTMDYSNDSWQTLISEDIEVEEGKIYSIEFWSDADEGNCIALFSKNDDGFESDAGNQVLALKIKGRSE